MTGYVLRRLALSHAHGPPDHRSVAGWDVQNRTWSAFRGPGVRPGAARKVPSRLVDVCPIICYLMGFPYPDKVEGAPLVDLLEG